MKKLTFLFILLAAVSVGCKKKGCTDPNATNYNSKATSDDGSCVLPEEVETGPYLIVKVQFDSLQPRLDNFGNQASIPATHSVQSPVFHGLSAHYLELAPNQYTQLQAGEIIYRGAETNAGGSMAADFSKAVIKGNNEVFVKIPLKSIATGTYQWLRASVTYQNFDLKYKYNNIISTGRLASFVGWNTYISNYKIRTMTETINANKLQGYWAFEDFGIVINGQAAGTTVVNPLHNTSPIPPGSCIVTGQFNAPLVITGNETQDITMTMSFSTNGSFEWYDDNQDGLYEPANGDYPTDMGLRGLKPIISQ
ncbi:hypothetical protein D3C87_408670 [compost metagenome]